MNSNLLQTTANLLSIFLGLRDKSRFSILIYHRVLPEPDELFPREVTKETFEWQMELIARYFNPLPLSEAIRLMELGKLPERAVCVTFDDGYADNETVALPIMKKWKIPATVFVASGYLNGGRMWNDSIVESIRGTDKEHLDLSWLGLGRKEVRSVEEKKQAILEVIKAIKYWPQEKRNNAVEKICADLRVVLPNDLMLTNSQVAKLHANGVTIGAHTVTHPILMNLDKHSVIEEVKENRKALESIIGDEVNTFAYPNGKFGEDYSKEQRDVIKDLGFFCAVSTHWGAVSKDCDKWQLPRFTPWDQTPLRFLIRLLFNYNRTKCNTLR